MKKEIRQMYMAILHTGYIPYLQIKTPIPNGNKYIYIESDESIDFVMALPEIKG